MKCLLLIWERTDIRCWIRLMLSNINVGGPWGIVVMWFSCTIISDYTMFSRSWHCPDSPGVMMLLFIVRTEDELSVTMASVTIETMMETMTETCSQEYEEVWHGDTLSRDDGHLIISVIIYLWSYFKLECCWPSLCWPSIMLGTVLWRCHLRLMDGSQQ